MTDSLRIIWLWLLRIYAHFFLTCYWARVRPTSQQLWLASSLEIRYSDDALLLCYQIWYSHRSQSMESLMSFSCLPTAQQQATIETDEQNLNTRLNSNTFERWSMPSSTSIIEACHDVPVLQCSPALHCRMHETMDIRLRQLACVAITALPTTVQSLKRSSFSQKPLLRFADGLATRVCSIIPSLHSQTISSSYTYGWYESGCFGVKLYMMFPIVTFYAVVYCSIVFLDWS